MPRVCILTVAWNQVEKTIACLETVIAQDFPAFSILLIDNGSSDHTAERVSERFPEVEIMRMDRNLGFAKGYNRGLERALADDYDYIFLINNDTLLAPDCLSKLVQEASADPNIGLVTAMIYYASQRDCIWTVGGHLHPWTLDLIGQGEGELDRGQWNEARDIDFAPLCGVLLNAAMLQEVGLLDEEFFMYYEDMDFCRRVRLAGFRLRCAPSAKMWHVIAASSGGRDAPHHRYWMAQSSGRYFRKHAPVWQMAAVLPYRLGSAFKISVSLLRRRRVRAFAAYWQGLVVGWVTGRATTPPPRWVTE